MNTPMTEQEKSNVLIQVIEVTSWGGLTVVLTERSYIDTLVIVQSLSGI